MTQARDGNTVRSKAAAALRSLATVPDEGWQVAGVNLYVVAGAAIPVDPKASLEDSRFWIQHRLIGDRTLYQASVPITIKDGKRLEAHIALHEVPDLLIDLVEAIMDAYPPWVIDGQQYIIAHIDRLIAPAGWQRTQERRSRQGHSAPVSWKEEKVARVVSVYMRGLVDLFDDERVGSPRGYYDHYDMVTQRIGHIAVGRFAAILGGVSDRAFQTFEALFQNGDMAPQGGLTRASYPNTLALIAQWNANQDVQRNVDQVRELRRSGDASATGQIWVSYALAVIGVILSLISFTSQPILLAPGLLILAGAGVIHSIYAQSSIRWVWRVGVVVFLVGTILTTAGLVLGIWGIIPSAALPFHPGVVTPTLSPAPSPTQ